MKNKKLSKLGNLKLRTRTKVLIPVLIAFILLSSAIPIADIKLGTDGSGVNWFGAIGVITNSNGKYWAATWGNIQLAVNDQDGNGTVWVPSGTYIPTSTLYINDSHVTLQGQGGAHWGTSGATIFNPSVELTNGIINVTGGTGFQIFDIKFNEGNTKPSHTTHAIKVRSSHGITVERCGFHCINGSAIYLEHTIYSASIINCDFQECGGYYGVNTYGTIVLKGNAAAYVTDVVIDNCVFEADYSYSIDEDIGERVSPVSIINSYFEFANTVPGVVAVKGVFRYGEISSNYFQGLNQHAIGIQITAGTSYCLIDDNFFTLWDDAIDLSGSYVTVSNNRITSSGDESIDGYSFCFIEDNTIKDSGGTAINSIGDDSSVSRNKIYNTSSDAIKLTGSNVLISKNIINNTNGNSGIEGFGRNNLSIIYNEINDVAIGINVENLDGKISDNTVQHATTYAIYCAAGSDYTLCHDNFISDCNGTIGIFVSDSHNLSIQDNQITKNGLTYGIRLGVLTTKDCFIVNNNFIGFTSNQLTAYSGATLGNQTILNNQDYNYNSLRDDYIWNSNGKYWAVSEANLLLAISDAGDQGVVYLPFCSITLTSDLDLDNVIVKGSGCGNLRFWGATHPYGSQTELKLGSGITITMTNCSKLQDVFVNCTNAHTVTAIHILAHNNPMWHVPNMLKNVIVNKYWQASASGTGVNISSIHDGASVDGGHISECSFIGVTVRGFKYGLVLFAKEAAATYIAGYTNSNTFSEWFFCDCENCIHLKPGANDAVVRANTFSDIHLHASTHYADGWGIKVEDERNMFTNIECMDWDVTVENGYALLINNTDKTYAYGFFAGDVGYGGASNYYIMDIETCDAITD